MKNYLQKCRMIESVSKQTKEKSIHNKKKINNTLMANHSKITNIINIKRMLINQVHFNSKFKTNKNSRKYKFIFIKFISLI